MSKANEICDRILLKEFFDARKPIPWKVLMERQKEAVDSAVPLARALEIAIDAMRTSVGRSKTAKDEWINNHIPAALAEIDSVFEMKEENS